MSAMSSKTSSSLRSAVETLQYARTDEQRAAQHHRQGRRAASRPADHRHCRCLAPRCRARAPRPSRSTWSCLRTWSTSPTRPRRTVLPTSASRWCARPMASTSPSPFSAMTIGLVRWCAISSTMPLPSRRQARPSRFGCGARRSRSSSGSTTRVPASIPTRWHASSIASLIARRLLRQEFRSRPLDLAPDRRGAWRQDHRCQPPCRRHRLRPAAGARRPVHRAAPCRRRRSHHRG